MNVGDTFTHQGVEYTVIATGVDEGKIEAEAKNPTPGPGKPPVLKLIIAEGDITP